MDFDHQYLHSHAFHQFQKLVCNKVFIRLHKRRIHHSYWFRFSLLNNIFFSNFTISQLDKSLFYFIMNFFNRKYHWIWFVVIQFFFQQINSFICYNNCSIIAIFICIIDWFKSLFNCIYYFTMFKWNFSNTISFNNFPRKTNIFFWLDSFIKSFIKNSFVFLSV